MRLLFTLLILCVLAGLTPAPTFDRYAPYRVAPEQTQEERAAQQSVQVVEHEVGHVPSRTAHESVPLQGADSHGADTVRNAAGQVSSRRIDPAGVLQQAEQDVQTSKRSPWKTMFMFLIAAGAGFGVVAAAKRWADKNLPAPKPLNRGRW